LDAITPLMCMRDTLAAWERGCHAIADALSLAEDYSDAFTLLFGEDELV
jgi:hypothetical protein